MTIRYGQLIICRSNYGLQDKLNIGGVYVAMSYSYLNKDCNLVVNVLSETGEEIGVSTLFFAPMTEVYVKRGHLELIKKIDD